jgi:triacylglycerol lipase
MIRMRLIPVLSASLCLLATAPAARAAAPRLTVGKAKLRAALKCTDGVQNAQRPPVMLVTGTGASGDEAYAIGKPAFDRFGAPVCWVNFPDHTTADVQVSVQYLVYGLRAMSARAGRPVAVFGISQGGLLPRIALTYWPSLRRKVSDVISAAGTQHGTSRGSVWTTVRSATDETVRPATGPHPTAALKGATNVLIQDVCPGRSVTHIGTALDSVTFALIEDAINHRGPAGVSRLPAGVCDHPYAPGLDEAATTDLISAAGTLTAGRGDSEPKVRREPRVRAWAKR